MISVANQHTTAMGRTMPGRRELKSTCMYGFAVTGLIASALQPMLLTQDFMRQRAGCVRSSSGAAVN